MAGRHILWIVDNKWRDLPGAVWAKLLLERRYGHKVTLVKNGYDPMFVAFRPDAIVYNNWSYPWRWERAKRLSSAGIANIIVPTEGAPFMPGIQRVEAGLHYDLSHVDLHFYWGPRLHDIAMSGPALPPERAMLVGCPRFDLYSPHLRGVLATREEIAQRHGIPADRKLVLLTTNYGAARFAEPDSPIPFADYEKDWKAAQMDSSGYTARQVAQCDHDSRDVYAANAKRAIEELTDSVFILRPHPNENAKYWEAWHASLSAGARARTAIAARGHIFDYLNASDIVVGRACTTSVEAWFLGRPTIEFQLHPGEWYRSKEIEAGSVVVEDYDAFRAALKSLDRDSPLSPAVRAAREAFAEEYYWKRDGHATERVAAGIHELVSSRPRSRLVLDKPFAGAAGRRAFHELTRWRYFGRQGKIDRSGADKQGRYDRAFRPEDVRAWTAKLAPFL